MTFSEIQEKVKESVECKCNDFGTPTAFHIRTEEDYKLVLHYQNEAHSTCCNHKELFKYDYKGNDWYFFKSETYGMDMGSREYAYRQETLTEKKQKFNEFCKQFKN